MKFVLVLSIALLSAPAHSMDWESVLDRAYPKDPNGPDLYTPPAVFGGMLHTAAGLYGALSIGVGRSVQMSDFEGLKSEFGRSQALSDLEDGYGVQRRTVVSEKLDQMDKLKVKLGENLPGVRGEGFQAEFDRIQGELNADDAHDFYQRRYAELLSNDELASKIQERKDLHRNGIRSVRLGAALMAYSALDLIGRAVAFSSDREPSLVPVSSLAYGLYKEASVAGGVPYLTLEHPEAN